MQKGIEEPQGIESYLRSELNQVTELKLKRQKHNRSYMFMLITMVVIFIAFVIYLQTKNFVISIDILFLVLIPFYSILLLLIILARPNSEFDNRIQQLNEEIDLLGIGKESLELRAEKQFKIHQNELKRYYDQSLKQNSWIFYTGIANLFVGFIIIGVTIFLVANSDSSKGLIVGILGGIAGILTNFIALIYLKMYSGTVNSLGEFHNRLVYTNHLHYSNLLVSKIYDEELRSETWAKLALSIAEREWTVVNDKEDNKK